MWAITAPKVPLVNNNIEKLVFKIMPNFCFNFVGLTHGQSSEARCFHAYQKNHSNVAATSLTMLSCSWRNNADIMGERYNIHSQLEHLQSKYIGTGHADTSKFEWLVNQHRDSLSSYIAHHDMLNFFAIAENESKARIRFNLTKKMLSPCGPPPERLED